MKENNINEVSIYNLILSFGVQEQNAIYQVLIEYKSATERFGSFNSAHEGYGVILEELDELWDEIKLKQSKREPDSLFNESKQVSAMGLRFMVDVCLKGKGFQ